MFQFDIYRDLLIIERRIVEVSRNAESLRRYIDEAEGAGGDASRVRHDLASMNAACAALRLQRNEVAESMRQMTGTLLSIQASSEAIHQPPSPHRGSAYPERVVTGETMNAGESPGWKQHL